jgi:V8-like Glu-specific endopeptidase
MACSKNEKVTSKNQEIQPNVVYGNDDRIDLYQINDPEWFDIAQSTVAIIDKKKLTENFDHYQISSTEFGHTYGLCSDEPFYEQPISAFCSGFLIGPEIIVTAGHCMRNEFNCEKARFVFNFNYNSQSNDPTIVAKNDVYNCKEIIHTETNALTGLDFAIVRLNKKVMNHPPLPIRTEDIITDDQKLAVIGHPSGLPAKFANGAKIRNNSEEFFFVANLDTYGGNSGSAVFNSSTKLIEGILVRGESDYLYNPDDKCRRSNQCDEDGCRGEDVVRISNVLDYLDPSELEPLALKPPATLLTPPIVY